MGRASNSSCSDVDRPRSALVLNVGGVGDHVLSLPLLGALTAAVTGPRTVIVGTTRRDLFRGLRGWRVLETAERAEVLAALRQSWDVVFDLATGPDRSLTHLGGYRGRCERYVEFTRRGARPGHVPIRRRSDAPAWRQLLSFARAIGAAPLPRSRWPRMPVAPGDRRYAELILDLRRPPRIACLAPGASSNPAKRWPPSRFAELGEALARDHGFEPVVLGRRAEFTLGREVARRCGADVANLAGIVPLGPAVHVIRRAALLVANDSGLLHLASYVGTPSVGVFGPTNPVKWRPPGPRTRLVVSPTGRSADVSVAEVLRACAAVLG